MRSSPALDLCPCARSAQHHSAGQPDARDIEPPLAEIEQVRIEQRGYDVATHDDEPEPRNERAVAKQGKVGGPHRDEYRDADEAELERDREDLAVGIRGDKEGICLRGRVAPEQLWNGPCAVADDRRLADQCERFL